MFPNLFANSIGGSGGVFKEYFRCFDMTNDYKYQGKVILPPSALAKLTILSIVERHPMLFSVSIGDKKVYVGVLEFTAEEGKCLVPGWVSKSLGIGSDSKAIVCVESVLLRKGVFVKIQPQSVDFLDISDHKSVLEYAMRNYSCLTKDCFVWVYYNKKLYELKVVEAKSAVGEEEGISIIETDLSVDFLPPVGWVEPEYEKKKHDSTHSMKDRIEEHLKESPSKFSAFGGEGQRLSTSKRTLLASRSQTSNSTKANTNDTDSSASSSNGKIKALRLPANKLWFGFDIVEASADANNSDSDSSDKPKAVFQGKGMSLRNTIK